jgi:hypothetical protein
MAQLTYDFPIGYDRNVEFDALLAPASRAFRLEVSATTGTAELTSDAEPVFDVTGRGAPIFESRDDGDTTPRLGSDTDLTLEIEADQ